MSRVGERWLVAKIWKRTPPFWRYAITISSVLFVSVVDVWLAARANRTDEGTMGGAVATIFALAILFLRPDWGKRHYEARLEAVLPTATGSEMLAAKVDALEAWLVIDNADHAKQTKALAFATAIGTIFWAFGDKFACHLHHLLSASK